MPTTSCQWSQLIIPPRSQKVVFQVISVAVTQEALGIPSPTGIIPFEALGCQGVSSLSSLTPHQSCASGLLGSQSCSAI